MKEKIIFIFLLLFLMTGCTADYTVKIFDGKIEESLYVTEGNFSKLDVSDDMGMSFRDYSKEYGIGDKIYTSYYNMYSDDRTSCVETSDNDCRFYAGEYIENSDEVGFSLKSDFDFEGYADATIPNDLMPGFSSSFDGRYLSLNGGINWNFIKGYSELETININIETNYNVTATNASYKGRGKYVWTVDRTNMSNLPALYMIIDISSTRSFASSYSWIVAIVMVGIALVAIIFATVKLISKNKNNNRI